MPTIRQIAALAGVSISTVSLALRGDPHVRPETRERIRQLAEMYHYRPVQSAPSTENSAARLLGCIVPDVTSISTMRTLRSMLEVAFAESYQLIVLESQNESQRILQAIHVLVEHRINGLLISVNQMAPVPESGWLELHSNDVVLVLFDSSIENNKLDEVRLDEVQIGECAVQYLFDYGHREIAYVGAIRSGLLSMRAQSFQRALRRHGLSTKHFLDLYHARYAECNTSLALADLLRAPNPPTAIFTGNDEVAIRLMMGAQAMGIRIPQDISVMGAGDLLSPFVLTPQLTTINEQMDEVGRSAMRLLLQRLQPAMAAAPPQFWSIAPILMKRASCGAPRRSSDHVEHAIAAYRLPAH